MRQARWRHAAARYWGDARHPLSTADFSTLLLRARSSKAEIVALASAGADTVNAIKQAGQFGIMRSGQRVAALHAFITDINSVGLDATRPPSSQPVLLERQRRHARLRPPFFATHKRVPTVSRPASIQACCTISRRLVPPSATMPLWSMRKCASSPSTSSHGGAGAGTRARHLRPRRLWGEGSGRAQALGFCPSGSRPFRRALPSGLPPRLAATCRRRLMMTVMPLLRAMPHNHEIPVNTVEPLLVAA